MPRVKKHAFEVSLGDGLGTVRADVVFHVNAAGQFYCQVPSEVLDYFSVGEQYQDGVTCRLNKSGQLTLYANTLDALEDIIVVAIRACNTPEVITELVIQYNLESHVSFAETQDGTVHPNAQSGGAQWSDGDTKKMYGGHYASNKNEGGYSLTIGAMAMVKTTSKVGERVSIKYSRYYKSGSHFDTSDPSGLLNSWTGFNLPKNPKEIPYTDEAALFFHNLMLGMARLSKQIQEATFDQDNLLRAIKVNALQLAYTAGGLPVASPSGGVTENTSGVIAAGASNEPE